ncbi:MAG: hypothetical protein COY09_02320 [Candidatus Portnoybacteria bacterium CG_4_10_14_0_2_um_filter_39_11]|uniref:Uncharacterized protein n=1 Tax=Candidatus Portnoybacteria bacterium CG_4_10_14_0_2_um_filter_39_11 TaxID=1974797 RepID=A0A2M7UHT7_9BACT|nr:MAG: hypothetical protein COY09_02320 [Candidatus Portnoybacteria bacterium CG_4_10_14_0_2_um_filter_39_11]
MWLIALVLLGVFVILVYKWIREGDYIYGFVMIIPFLISAFLLGAEMGKVSMVSVVIVTVCHGGGFCLAFLAKILSRLPRF